MSLRTLLNNADTELDIGPSIKAIELADPMDVKVKKKWVKNLRSGKFAQGEKKLRNESGDVPRFCCLGVLCETVGVKFKEDKGYNFQTKSATTGNIEDVFWDGITPAGWQGLSHNHTNLCWKLNDIYGFSFEEIADVIEEHF